MKDKVSGLQGEEIASEYLKNKGFEILSRNFRSGHKEIDIIAEKGDIIHFIEVKTRKNEDWIDLMDNVNERKIDLVTQAAEDWLEKNNKPESFWQIDFIGIILDKNNQVKKVEFIEDIS